jgi:hypothetical protein
MRLLGTAVVPLCGVRDQLGVEWDTGNAGHSADHAARGDSRLRTVRDMLAARRGWHSLAAHSLVSGSGQQKSCRTRSRQG